MLFSIDFTSVISTNKPQELEYHPLKHLNGLTQVIGSFDGLVSFCSAYHFDESGNVDMGLDLEYCIWNPSTRMFRKLPVCPGNVAQGRRPDSSQISSGFGYDTIADDYKIVKISQCYYHNDGDSPTLVSEMMVYSLKLDLWKKVVEDCPYWLYKEDNGMLSAGILYWIVSGGRPPLPGSSCIIIGFHLACEKFYTVSFPENLGAYDVNLTVLGGLLCLLSSCKNAVSDVLDHVDIWGLQNFTFDQRWTKLFSVKQLDGPQQFNFVDPVAYSGKELLLEVDHEKFIWYSNEKKSFRPVNINVGLDYVKSFVCMETLVPVYGGSNEKEKMKKVEPYEENSTKKIEEGDDVVIKEFNLEHQKQLE